MASNLTPPRTAFHRRIQGLAYELENGFGRVGKGVETLQTELKIDLKSVNDRLFELTAAVQSIPGGTPSTASQCLIREVKEVLGSRKWDAKSLPVESSVGEAIKVMVKLDIRTLLITSKDKRNLCVGMVTPSLLFAAVGTEGLEGRLEKIMIPRESFLCIHDRAPVAEALRLFRDKRVKRLFVANGNDVHGILTLSGCVRWLADCLLTTVPVKV